MGEGPSGDFSTRDPYVAQDGKVWFVAQAGNDIAWLDPATGDRHQFEIEDGTNRYNLIVNEDGYVWYVDEPRGQLGRISPATGDVAEWAMPGGEGSRPYALTKDDRDRLRVSETGPEKQLVGFDPASEEFSSLNEVSHNIRHMMCEPEARAMWFGTDANRVGRILTGTPIHVRGDAIDVIHPGMVPAFKDGPPARTTGGCGEESCVGCHFGADENDGVGRIEILGLPEHYSPGGR